LAEPPTPLELQAIQARDFKASKISAFAAVITMFQDLGYVIQSADKDTGFVTATSPTVQTGELWEDLAEQKQTKATAFVEERTPGQTRVRLNFVTFVHQSTYDGQTLDHQTAILDAHLYENAFDRIGEGIFVRSAAE
jgi:hypothetical protein